MKEQPLSPTPPPEREFYVVASDGRTYGPISEKLLRGWIRAGCVNGQCLIPAESRHQWRKLEELPEFADALAAAAKSDILCVSPPPEFLAKEPIRPRPQAAAPVIPSVPAPEPAKQPATKSRLRPVLAAVLIVVVVGAGGALYWSGFWMEREASEKMGTDFAYAAAGRAEEAGNYVELLRHARTLVRRYPRQPRPYYVLGVALGKLGELDDAGASLGRAITLRPDFEDAWNNLGWVLNRQGRFAGAVVAFQAILKNDPTDAQAWCNLGGALAGQRRNPEAIAAYQKAVQLRPNYPEAHYNLGIAHAEQRQYVEAVEAFQTALKQNPQLADAWYNLGLVSQMQGQEEEAVVFYQQATKLRPDYADAWGGLVKAYLKLGQSDEAAAAARTMKQLDPAKAGILAEELGKTAPPVK
jgi:tetratricopeptide (TPR) repeat protein